VYEGTAQVAPDELLIVANTTLEIQGVAEVCGGVQYWALTEILFNINATITNKKVSGLSVKLGNALFIRVKLE
jgi:hypothetical protein